MDNDLISRSALLAEYDRVHVGEPGGARKLIEQAPAVDAEPVRHAQWLPIYFDAVCSACNYISEAELVTRIRKDPKRCPRCGAKMDGGKRDGEQNT